MFDFVNDDERIILVGSAVILAVFFAGIILILKILSGFLLSRKKLALSSATAAGRPSREKYDVFVSYSHKDKDQAEWLTQTLRNAGIRVFLSSSELAAGDNFGEEIREALTDVGELWFLATPSSLRSEWVMTEWGAAWAMGKRVVPVLHRCDAAELPERLAALHIVSAAEVGRELAHLKKRLADR